MRTLTVPLGNLLVRNQAMVFGLLVLGAYALAVPPQQVFGSEQLEHLKDVAASVIVVLGLAYRLFIATRRGATHAVDERRFFWPNVVILLGIFVMHGHAVAILFGATVGSAILLFMRKAEPPAERTEPSLIAWSGLSPTVRKLAWEGLVVATTLGVLFHTEIYEYLPSDRTDVVQLGLLGLVAALLVSAALTFRRQLAGGSSSISRTANLFRGASVSVGRSGSPVAGAWSREQVEEMLATETFGYQRIELPYGLATPGKDRRWTADQIFPEDMSGCSVLDIGCNHGYFCFEAYRRGATRVVGYDFKSSNVRKARLLSSCLGVSAEFHVRNIEENPIEERFDYVLCLNVLHHLEEPVHVLNALAGIAKQKLVLEVAGVNLSFFLRRPGVWPLLACLLARAPILYLGEDDNYGRGQPGKSSLSFRITRAAMLRLLADGPRAFAQIETKGSKFRHRTIFIATRELPERGGPRVAHTRASGNTTRDEVAFVHPRAKPGVARTRATSNVPPFHADVRAVDHFTGKTDLCLDGLAGNDTVARRETSDLLPLRSEFDRTPVVVLGADRIIQGLSTRSGDAAALSRDPLAEFNKEEPKFSWSGEHDNPVFCESPQDQMRRWALGCAYALQPRRIHLMPALVAMTVAHALKDPSSRGRLPVGEPIGKEGLIGICGNLTPTNIIEGYRRGFIPTCHIGPMKWWRPAERAVLYLEDAHVETKIKKLLRKGVFRVTFDMDFAAVMQACTLPRPGKVPLTWITPTIMKAFWHLHQLGYAHSVEVWDNAGRLVGGIYGLALGQIFFGESQFSIERDTSKIASAVLNSQLGERGFILRDAKWMTAHHSQGGFKTISRNEFEGLLATYAGPPDLRGEWTAASNRSENAEMPAGEYQ